MIGRERERNLLLEAFASDSSEFVAVYGRRRVGKTFLIRETFNQDFTFQHTGVKNGSCAVQLSRFRQSMVEQGYPSCPDLKNWFDAFDNLKVIIKESAAERKVVFIDEIPWMGRSDRNFISAVENFWNGWASARKDVLLVVCGSATSWVLDKIVHNRDGLHNRVTYRIRLDPFTLRECEEYAHSRGLEYTRDQLAECYMILGGIPMYWRYLERGKSVAQNIDEMFFSGSEKLENEFDELYASLFEHPEPYLAIVTAMARRKCGMTREEVSNLSGLENSGALSRYLKVLEQCGFIRKFTEIGKKTKCAVFQLMDSFTLFYFRFIEANKSNDPHFWSAMSDSRVHSTWAGLAFERLCLQHIDGIKRALGISGVLANVHSWRNANAQIDLLIDRRDGIINICEMKYWAGPYVMTAEDDVSLMNKKSEFKAATKTRKAVHVTMVTSFGVKQNAYSGKVQSFATLDDLFGC
ncbi:MAG: AAA family ATPase [Kiritimatiellae bacterium]|nr:AAA family ATPase [Kiritimatiellia bacterium]